MKEVTTQIVSYEPKYKTVFKELNVAWIETYFKMESSDYKALDHPEEYILDNGGYIAVALLNNEPVGVCALIKMNDDKYGFEVAKMAVSPKAQGKQIGWKLGQYLIGKAKSVGAKAIYLETNTVLVPAIALYHKLGFKEIKGQPTPYERCNYQMELVF